MIGDGAARTDNSSLLYDELRAVRQAGLTRIHATAVPHLREAAQLLDPAGDLPVGEAVRRLILSAIERLGEEQETVTLAHVFGVAPGTRLRSATDRRRAAARAQGVSVERFRHGYEPQLLQLVADEIATMLHATRRTGPQKTALPAALVMDDMPLAATLAAANVKADWREVRGAYRQCLALVADEAIRDVPEAVLGGVSRAFERLTAAYAGDEEQFLVHAMATVLDVDGADRFTHGRLNDLYDDERFRRLTAFARTSASAPRPVPFETYVETIRRVRDLRSLHDAVMPVASSAVVGGSSSYSRFHRIRGTRADARGSDLDLIVVVHDGAAVDATVALVAELPAVDRASAEALVARARTFSGSGLDDGRTVFSHKLALWSDASDPLLAWRSAGSGAYVLDLRILTASTLSWLLLADAARIDREVTGNWRAIRDYGDRRSYSEDDQRSFSGRNLRFTVSTDNATGGVLRTTRAYFLDDSDRFYPGTLQNLVLPLADCRWDGIGIGPLLHTFRDKVDRRLAYERQSAPDETLLLSLAHARSASFTVSALRQADR